MNRESRNCQAPSSQSTHSACLTTGQQGYIELISDWRPCRLAVDVGKRPIPHECRVACDPNVSESHSLYPTTPGVRWNQPSAAALCHALIACGLFTLIAWSSSMIRPPPSAACHSSRVAGQHFISRPLPHKAPKCFLPLARSPA